MFHCKNELFTVMKTAQERLGHRHLAYGMNLDDRAIFGPAKKRRISMACWRRSWKPD
jgi:uncharacterized protein